MKKKFKEIPHRLHSHLVQRGLKKTRGSKDAVCSMDVKGSDELVSGFFRFSSCLADANGHTRTV